MRHRPEIAELIKIGASQINGCAYCLDMHTKDARTQGETEQRIYALNAARLVPEIGCPTNIMAGPGAPTIAELEQLGVTRVTFGTGLMRATLPLIRQMAQELRTSGICDSLAQTEFTHGIVSPNWQKVGY